MAKTVYSFKLGQRNFFGLTYDKLGGNLPADSLDKWRPFKTFVAGKGMPPRLGLSDEAFKDLDANGFHLMRGLRIVVVETGQVAPPAQKKKPARKKK